MPQVCTNSDCKNGLPRYQGFGAPGRKCPDCGKTMRVLKMEPRGTRHGAIGSKNIR